MNAKGDGVVHWTEVMGNNMVYPTPSMLYKPTVVIRKTRLKTDEKNANRLLSVVYDREFVKWRLLNIFREFDSYNIPQLKTIFKDVLEEIERKVDD